MPFPRGRAIIPTLQMLLFHYCDQGIPVVYINEAHRPDYDDVEFKKRGVHCIAGSWGADVIDELKPEPGDHVVGKRRYSGFYDTDAGYPFAGVGREDTDRDRMCDEYLHPIDGARCVLQGI